MQVFRVSRLVAVSCSLAVGTHNPLVPGSNPGGPTSNGASTRKVAWLRGSRVPEMPRKQVRCIPR